MMRLAHICRHPIKSIGFETLDRVALTAGRTIPFDRTWGVLHEAAQVSSLTAWVPKMNFLRGVAGHQLMAISARLDESSRRVTLTHPSGGEITLCPDTEGAALVDWLRPLWPDDRPAPSAVGHVPDTALTDVPEAYVSILNIGSNADLGGRMGVDLSIHRWRGNLWIDGMEAWAEAGLMGRRLAIGNAVVEVRAQITRCKATTVNPATGAVDADTLAALNSDFGHQDFGVYAMVVEGSLVALDDKVTVL
jgi:uncharacterized protein YcbX